MKSKLIVLSAMLLMMASTAFAGFNGNGQGRRAVMHSTGFYACKQCFRGCSNISDANRENRCDYAQRNCGGRPALRDADGDGIPNGRDPDFTRRFVDSDGNGVCDSKQNASTTPVETG